MKHFYFKALFAFLWRQLVFKQGTLHQFNHFPAKDSNNSPILLSQSNKTVIVSTVIKSTLYKKVQMHSLHTQSCVRKICEVNKFVCGSNLCSAFVMITGTTMKCQNMLRLVYITATKASSQKVWGTYPMGLSYFLSHLLYCNERWVKGFHLCQPFSARTQPSS